MEITLAMAIFIDLFLLLLLPSFLHFLFVNGGHLFGSKAGTFFFLSFSIVMSCCNGVGNVVCNISTGARTGSSAI
jgi:hypothetical protein